MTSKGDKLAKEFFDYDYKNASLEASCEEYNYTSLMFPKPGQLIRLPQDHGILGGAIGAAAGSLIGIGEAEKKGEKE